MLRRPFRLRKPFRLPVVLAGCLLSALASLAGEPVTIEGRVLDDDGGPVIDAEILVLPTRPSLERVLAPDDDDRVVARTRSDASGAFRIDAPHPGMWSLEVRAGGFVDRVATLQPLVEPVLLPELRLPRERALAVTVVDASGQPVAGATVAAHTPRPRFGAAFWQRPLRLCTTDASGRCRLVRAERDRVDLSVSDGRGRFAEARAVAGSASRLALSGGAGLTVQARDSSGQPLVGAAIAAGGLGHPLGRTDADGRFVVVRPGTGDVELALVDAAGHRVEHRVPNGASPDAAFEMRLPAVVAIDGRVIASDSRHGVPGAVVWDARDPSRHAIADGDGAFRLSAPRGARLDLRAAAAGHLGSRAAALTAGAVGQVDPTLIVDPAAAVAGRVVDASGLPVAGAEITVREKRDHGSFRIEIGGESRRPRTESREDGSFRLGPVDPSRRWELDVEAAGFAPLVHGLGRLTPRRTLTDVELTLEPGATLVGRLVDADGIPLDGGEVRLTPAARGGGGPVMMMPSGGGGPAAEATSDGDGAFRLEGIPVGKFDLEATRAGFASRELPGIEILESGELLEVGDFVLDPGETLQGRVVDADGAPVEGASVAVGTGGVRMMMIRDPEDFESAEPDARTDVNGWFSIGDLDPKSNPSLTVSRTGYVSYSSGPQSLPQDEPLELVLQPASDIGGVVLDGDGEPIVDASVRLSRTRTMQMGGNAMMMQMVMDATTDASGRFLFEDEEPGTVSIAASAAGFQEAKRDDLEVPKGEDLLDVELRLAPGAILQGRVRMPDGRPAIGAEVKTVGSDATGRDYMPGAPVDGNGIYRLEGLSAGPVSVEATSDSYPRVVRDVTLENGLNTLDLEFAGGQPVRGDVRDETGEPVADAVVRLVEAGRFWGGPEAITDGSGRFEVPGVRAGEYRIAASAADFASTNDGPTVRVEAAPVDGIQVVLRRGATLEGRVLGVEPDAFARVSVSARGTGFGAPGSGVDYEGRFRLENLAPGSFDVVAKLDGSGRQARERVTIEPGQTTASVDLVFGGGLTLSGVALQADRPVANATVYAGSRDTGSDGWGPTDSDGRFSIDGLEPGTYTVQLQDFRSGLSHAEEVELSADREIELRVPTGVIVGRVSDGGDRRPLAGVTLSLQRVGEEERSPFSARTATSDIDGRFRLLDVADGTWTLNARKQGFAAQQQQVQVQFGAGPENLRLVLDPTEGMTLETRLPNGLPPAEVDVAVLTPSGAALVRDSVTTGENGRIRLSTVPAGEWDVLLEAGGSATTRVRARASGATTSVVLEPASRLEIVVPELVADGAPATARLVDASGRPYVGLAWGARPIAEWSLYGGRTTLAQLPAGSWSVEVRAGERAWQGRVDTAPGRPAVLTLE